MSEDAGAGGGDSNADSEIGVEIPPLDEAAREQARRESDYHAAGTVLGELDDILDSTE